MSLKNISSIVALVLSLAASAVGAKTITFKFSGQVTYGGPMAVTTGTAVVGTFSYDLNADPGIKLKNYAQYQFQSPAIMKVSFGGHAVTSDLLDVSLMNNTKSNVGDIVDVTGTSPVLDGTTLSNGAVGFRIASAYDNNAALKSTRLPRHFQVKKFDAGPTMNYGYLQADGGQNGMLLEFSMDSITVINDGK